MHLFRRFFSVILVAALALPGVAGHADPDYQSGGSTTVTVSGSTTIVEEIEWTEWDDTVELDEPLSEPVSYAANHSRFVPPSVQDTKPASLLRKSGPFRLVDASTIEMRGSVNSRTPNQFRAILAANPGIRTLRMIDCPGSDDDEANLRLARMVRSAGISTYVPANGSVRSGAVELFLAGVTRHADDGAEFAVHSWMDEDGFEASDYPANDPVHAEYLGYYRDIGMNAAEAKRFYDLTNSVSFHDALWLDRDQLSRYVRLD